MAYNKYINSFANSNEYNAYLWSADAYSPNIGFIEETKQVKWEEKTIADYIVYGTTKGTADFMIGSSVNGGTADCIKVHVVKSTDGTDNKMYANKEDIVNTPVQFSNIGNEITSIKKWNIDTSNVINMTLMFGSCHNLKYVDLSYFDTSKVTNMNGMFLGCGNLTYLDVSNFDTSKVTNMSYMFSGCSGLTSLNLSTFNTSKVTTMSSMFDYTNFELLDLSGFDTSNVTDTFVMFDDANVKSLKLSSSYFNSPKIVKFMFGNLTGWTEATSLSQFVNAISSKEGTGKTVYLSTETKNVLTTEQKNRITSKGWTIR